MITTSRSPASLPSSRTRSSIPGRIRDRKSTRLNSSHTVISTLSLHDALPILEKGITEGLRRSKREPIAAQGGYLMALKAASEQLQINPNDQQARDDYNFAVARIFTIIKDAKLDPWTNPRSEEHTSELQSHSDLHSFPTRRSSDLRERYHRGAPAEQARTDRGAGRLPHGVEGCLRATPDQSQRPASAR